MRLQNFNLELESWMNIFWHFLMTQFNYLFYMKNSLVKPAMLGLVSSLQ